MAIGGAVRHCSVSSAFSEASTELAALLTEQWHTGDFLSAINFGHRPSLTTNR